MLLSIAERLLLLHLLPTTGNWSNLKALRSFREELGCSEEENALLDIRLTPDNQIKWDQQGYNSIPEKEVEIVPTMRQLITQRLRAMDQQEALSVDHISLCEKFLTKKASREERTESEI